MDTAAPLLPLLKERFGFDSFRPLQEEIIRDALDGKDVFALLPTGGGKSLCFQVPALVKPGLTLVVSPLIALMKDQVDALTASGIPATFLNSSLESDQSRSRLRGLHTGQFLLLYVAPERLMLSGFISDLQRWNVNLLAVDEAHCISEWGHDFRPEYRQLAELRQHLPNVPVMALTATATHRVREDIVKLLSLKSPSCFVASFNRPNLLYRVLPKAKGFDQLLAFIKPKKKECGIIYCQSRASAENLAEKLRDHGIDAEPYHAGLDAGTRAQNQERFLRDEVRVICATIAFGMGINKPNVRFVVHYDLPKNLEGYYQETGRAGRDGLPSECLLFFSAGDVVKQQGFIDDKTDPREQKIAREQLLQMVHYAESSTCRRVELLKYFGETYAEGPCNACDNCLAPRETYDGTLDAQKFLSCIYRIRQKSGFDVGLLHIVEVLAGAQTERIQKWNHQTLSTYGIGKDKSRAEWQSIGRELVRLGCVRQRTTDKFTVWELTPHGVAVLTKRTPVTLTRMPKAPEPIANRKGDIPCDEVLFERLRQLRRELADARDVPAYIIFSDVALRQMAREYPRTRDDFSRISGVGEKKLEEFGQAFLTEIAAHLKVQAPQEFKPAPIDPPVRPKRLTETVSESLKRYRAGMSVEGIAKDRGFAQSTIYEHLHQAAMAGEAINLDQVLTQEQQKAIDEVFAAIGSANLAGANERLGPEYCYGQLKLYREVKQK